MELNSNRLDSMISFDYDSCTSQKLDSIKMYLQHKVFAPEKIVSHSEAAAALCSWVIAVDKHVHSKHSMWKDDHYEPEQVES